MDTDITPKGLMTDSLKRILDTMPGGVYAFIPGGVDAPIFINRQFLDMLGVGSREEIWEYTGHNYWNIIYADDQEKVRNAFHYVAQAEGSRESFECRLVSKKGDIRLVRAMVQCEKDAEGNPIQVFFSVDLGLQNLMDTKRKMDPLTGLLKSGALLSLMREYAQKMESGEITEKPVFLYYDLINFRFLNIRYGMKAGDDFLREVGRILEMVFPEEETARLDGDHFAVFTGSSHLEERIHRSKNLIMHILSGSVVDCAIGACSWDDPALDAEVLWNRAKIACDDNKKQVNRDFSYYTAEMGEKLDIADYVVSHVDEAIQKDWIRVYYQPIVRSISNEICGMEALARWDDPNRGLLMPGRFIPPLEEEQKIWKLDICVIRQAAALIAEREKKGLPEIPISVNLSRVDFLCCDIFKEVEAIVRQYDIPRRMFHIEVTESALAFQDQVLIDALGQFRAAGYEIWMDDFGSGYSTLNLLKDYSYDVLKLDMAFLRNDSSRSRSIIASVLAMDKKVGMRTLTEGVETKAQCDFLRNSGCDFMQGYYFGKPLPFEESLKTSMEKGLEIEMPAQKKYYDALSSVNFMTDLPMMLIEFTGHAFHVLYMNDRLRAIAAEDGYDTKEKVDEFMQDMNNAANREVALAAETAVRSGGSGEFYYPFQQEETLCRYKIISSSEGRYLFEVHIFPQSKQKGKMPEKIRTLLHLRYFYRGLYLIHPASGMVQSIRFSRDDGSVDGFIPLRGKGQLSGVLPVIFKADEQSYISFMDTRTMEERLDNGDQSIISSIFRTRDVDGEFRWMVHKILRIPNSAQHELLYVVRVLDIGGAKEELKIIHSDPYHALMTAAGRDNEDKAALWADLMMYLPIPIFWKDRNRRFMGANQCFLNYYGFSSVESILGKTDEDMGWHPGERAYMDDEEEVMKSGTMHVNVPGRCIARGVAHQIMATKWPVYREGRVSGLMGFFQDEQMIEKMTNRGLHLIDKDPETGLANTPRFMDLLARYEEDYRFEKKDFGIIFIRIPELTRIADIYGVEAGQLALKACARAITDVVDHKSVAARVGICQFAVLYKYKTPNDIRELGKRISNAVEAVKLAGTNRVTLFAYIRITYAHMIMEMQKSLVKSFFNHGHPLEAENSYHTRVDRDRLLHQLVEALPMGCYIIRPDHRILYWNHGAEELLGYSAEYMLGKKCIDMGLECSRTDGVTIPRSQCPAIVAFATGRPQTLQMFMRRADGRDILIKNTLVPLQDESGKTDELISLFTPLTEDSYDESVIHEIYEVATRDPITCLPGRKYMESCLESELEAYHRTGRLFAVLFADADNFHDINNTYGHNAGDETLQAFGIALRKQGRKADRFCRWGGDEFVGLLLLRDAKGSEGAARRFAKIAGGIQVKAGEKILHFGISIGITVVREDDTVRSIVDRADRYMYLAKSLPDDRVVTDFNVEEIEKNKN
ncbi:diguanylate cyclase domain-containing protein [Dialister sp.]|uniref:diguanylate cyclase domain-containing protein n=1 Tax=Dialister sp. TaxID=1955814 RepID=UPI003F11A5E0